MPVIKRLSSILTDTLARIRESAQQYRNVSISFHCYRNNQRTFQSDPLTAHQFATGLSTVCRRERATKVSLIINGSDGRGVATELYRNTFLLAAKPSRQVGLGGYGNGAAMPSIPNALQLPPEQGLGLAETAALVNKMVGDQLFRNEHEQLLREAEDLRRKIAGMETELKEQEALLDARASIKENVALVAPFAPIIANLVGRNTLLGNAINGLGGTDQAGLQEAGQAADDEQTTMVIGMVRDFMKNLKEGHRGQLISVMLRIQQDHNLITRIAQFVQGGTATRPNPNANPARLPDAASPTKPINPINPSTNPKVQSPGDLTQDIRNTNPKQDEQQPESL